MKDPTLRKTIGLIIWLLLGNYLVAQEANPNIEVENMGIVNSNKLDFSPTFYKDGIVFVSNRKRPKSAKKITDEKDEWLGDNFMSLYYAPQTSEGFDMPMEFSVNITTRYHEGPVSFSKDGTRIFFTRNNYEDGEKKTNRKGDTLLKIYSALKNGNDWTSITELPFNVEDYDQCHPALSADGRTLIFSSNREGGYGGMDLYKSEFLNGQWSAPANLGPHINTTKNEVFPYVHETGKLYFASNGHGGYGGLDVYAAKRMNSTWGAPTNIGSPINTLDDDFGYVVDATGKSGFFSSARKGGLGKDDVYKFTIHPPKVAPAPEEEFTEKGVRKIIAGTISDGVSGKRLEKARVSLLNRLSGQKMTTITDDKGEFAFRSSPLHDGFVLQVSKAGYNAYAEDLNIVQLAKEDRSIKEYFFLLNPVGTTQPPPAPVTAPVVTTSTPVATTPVKATDEIIFKGGAGVELDLGKTLILEEILFEYGSYDLQITSLPILDDLVNLLKKYPTMGAELSAHTDSRGNASYNERLSRRRAESVVTYLVQQGIPPTRLIPIGKGETAVRNGCIDGVPCSESQHKANRRIEMNMIQLVGY